MSDKSEAERRGAPRISLDCNVEVMADGSLSWVKTVDVSATGCRVEAEHPMVLNLCIEDNGRIRVVPARLVWAQKGSGDRICYGLEYLDEEEEQ